LLQKRINNPAAFIVLIGLLLSVPGASRGDIYVESSYILTIANTSLQDIIIGTSSSYTPAYASLLYHVNSTEYTMGSSHIVLNVDGTAYDLQGSYTVASAMTASGSGLGAYIQGSKIMGKVTFLSRYEIVNNVETGTRADMMKLMYVATNRDTSSHQVGCRVELDTEVNGNDGTNVSVDNGFSVVSTSSSAWTWKKENGDMPSGWWDYDVPPPGTATLVGRGVLAGNVYGDAATPPDVFEVANWSTVNDAAQWTLSTSAPVTDSAVVIWWTGTGSESGLNQLLAPGEAVTWIAYYGLNQGVLQATPTPTPTPTVTDTPTITLSPTITDTPTITLTPTITETPTETLTPTETWTPTETSTPTETPTETATETPTSTPTETLTPTWTFTPTETATPTSTPTPSSTPTVTLTPTITKTPTETPTVTASPTRTPTATPTPLLYVWPIPFNPKTAVGGVMKASVAPVGSTMSLFTVSGEKVNTLQEEGGMIRWDGRNAQGQMVADGTYYYVVKNVGKVYASGKVIVVIREGWP